MFDSLESRLLTSLESSESVSVRTLTRRYLDEKLGELAEAGMYVSAKVNLPRSVGCGTEVTSRSQVRCSQGEAVTPECKCHLSSDQKRATHRKNGTSIRFSGPAGGPLTMDEGEVPEGLFCCCGSLISGS